MEKGFANAEVKIGYWTFQRDPQDEIGLIVNTVNDLSEI